MRSELSPLLWVTGIYILALLPVRYPLINTEWRVKCRPCWHGAHTVLVAAARAVEHGLVAVAKETVLEMGLEFLSEGWLQRWFVLQKHTGLIPTKAAMDLTPGVKALRSNT